MAITKKPVVDNKKADAFISGAAADNAKPEKRNTASAVNRDKVKPEKRQAVKTEKSETANMPKKKLTFYMPGDMYLKWKGYELSQLQAGKKVSFQSVIEKHMNRLLK